MIETPSKPSRGRMAVLFFLHAVCGALVYLLLGFVPRSEKFFKDSDIRLPERMVAAVDLSRWFAARWIGLASGLAAGDLAVMFLLHRTGRARLMTAWGVCLWLAEIVLIGLILFAVVSSMSDVTRLP